MYTIDCLVYRRYLKLRNAYTSRLMFNSIEFIAFETVYSLFASKSGNNTDESVCIAFNDSFVSYLFEFFVCNKRMGIKCTLRLLFEFYKGMCARNIDRTAHFGFGACFFFSFCGV